jgi:hypothetical protein
MRPQDVKRIRLHLKVYQNTLIVKIVKKVNFDGGA